MTTTQQAGVYRGKEDDETSDILLDLMDAPLKEFYKYDPTTFNALSFMTTKNPNVAMHLIEKAIIAQGPAFIEADKAKYRIRFDIKGAISTVTAKVKIFDVSKGVYLVDFTKLKGDKTDFMEVYEKLMNDDNGISEMRNYTAN